jgi:cation diffusion facilitator family transporter
MSGALALTSDGFHSLSDGSTNVIGLISLHWAHKPADDDHHYGHEKIEVMAAMGIAVGLLITAWELLTHSLQSLSEPVEHQVGALAFVVVGVTFLVNVFVTIYERRAAKRTKSLFLEADAAHTASDLGVTGTVAISLVALKYDVPYVDPVVSVLIAFYIGYIAWTIMAKNAFVLTDTAPLQPAVIENEVMTVPGVMSCHKVRTRGWEGNIFIDLHIQVDPELSTLRSHEITHAVEDRIKSAIDGVRDVVIHTEPYEAREADAP